jgi:hypothetical protein
VSVAWFMSYCHVILSINWPDSLDTNKHLPVEKLNNPLKYHARSTRVNKKRLYIAGYPADILDLTRQIFCSRNSITEAHSRKTSDNNYMSVINMITLLLYYFTADFERIERYIDMIY